MRDVAGWKEGEAAAVLRGGSTRISTTPPQPPHRPLDLATGRSTGAAMARTITITSQLRSASGRSRESGWNTRKLRHGWQTQRETPGAAAAHGRKELTEEAPFLHPGPKELTE